MPDTDPNVLRLILNQTQKANDKLDKIEDAIARQDQMLIAHDSAILHLNRLVWADAGGLTTRVGQIETMHKLLGDDVTKVHLRIGSNESFKWSLLLGSIVTLLGICGSLVVWGLDQRSTIKTVQEQQKESVKTLETVKTKQDENIKKIDKAIQDDADGNANNK